MRRFLELYRPFLPPIFLVALGLVLTARSHSALLSAGIYAAMVPVMALYCVAVYRTVQRLTKEKLAESAGYDSSLNLPSESSIAQENVKSRA